MGHYVVARLLGFRTSDVSLEIIGPINGHRGEAAVILGEPMRTLEEVGCYLRRRIQVLYAGALAETLPPRQSPTKGVNAEEAMTIIELPETAQTGHLPKLGSLFSMLRNIKHPDERRRSMMRSSNNSQQLRTSYGEVLSISSKNMMNL